VNTDALPMMSAHDWELLRQQMRSVTYSRGQTILEEGRHRQALMVVRQGAVRVEQTPHGRGITLAQLGPGEVFGEMGFVENAAVSASVIALDDATVDVIDGEALQSLMASEPGFAVRFYHSLAITLARRLRVTSRRLAEAGTGEAAQVNRFRKPRTGNISARQVPPDLIARLEQFERTMLSADQAIRAGNLPDDQAAGRIADACDQVVALLQQYTGSDPLVEIGYSDLLAFRDTEQLEAGVGDYVFRETFPTMMLSATMARCYAKPRGFPEDHETVAAIYRNEAEGDARLGPIIDRWFLDHPICRSRRASRDLMRTRLAQIVREQPSGAPVRIASLASGVAAELFDLCQSDIGATVLATCVDLDEDALLASARRAERNGLVERMTFLQASVLPLENSGVTMLPQTIIYALGLCEYLADEQMVALLDRVFDGLVADGVAIVTNLAEGNPDRGLMGHVLDWKTHHRTAETLRGCFMRSRFGTRLVETFHDETGVNLFAIVTKIDAA
jgi:extracellular factor (EF) 3-hydroxypalmitic acid methyl ester biosynthesis protein